jgi:hypothetical protein
VKRIKDDRSQKTEVTKYRFQVSGVSFKAWGMGQSAWGKGLKIQELG